jgi:hypothetical protein
MKRSFDHEDITRFLAEYLNHLERFNPLDGHPYDNPWHSGDWAEEAEATFAAERDDFAHIIDSGVEHIIAAVGELANRLGYATGNTQEREEY